LNRRSLFELFRIVRAMLEAIDEWASASTVDTRLGLAMVQIATETNITSVLLVIGEYAAADELYQLTIGEPSGGRRMSCH
jgi:hypothetical protein